MNTSTKYLGKMRTLKKVEIEPVFTEFIPESLEQGKIYISEEYKTSAHLCLCGCNNEVVLPFGNPHFWSMAKTEKGVSFTPSVGTYNLPCQSHYIITNNIANFV